jgi:hypothetical protein
MATSFSDIAKVVIDSVRNVFSLANGKVTRVVSTHPFMREETLVQVLVMELTAAPTLRRSNRQTFFKGGKTLVVKEVP